MSFPATSSGRLYSPRVRTGSKAELPFMEESSPWRNSILLGLSLGYLLMDGHLCFRHPHVNQFVGVLFHSCASPVFPIWLVSAICCVSPVNIGSRMLHPLLPHHSKDHYRFPHLSAESDDKKSLNMSHREFLTVGIKLPLSLRCDLMWKLNVIYQSGLMALLALPLSAKNSGLGPRVSDCKLKLILRSLQKWEEVVSAQKTTTG